MVKTFSQTRHRAPDWYPTAFTEMVRAGEPSWWAYADFPWKPTSLQRRFRLFIQTLRASESHPLFDKASGHNWKWVEGKAGEFTVVASPRRGQKR